MPSKAPAAAASNQAITGLLGTPLTGAMQGQAGAAMSPLGMIAGGGFNPLGGAAGQAGSTLSGLMSGQGLLTPDLQGLGQQALAQSVAGGNNPVGQGAAQLGTQGLLRSGQQGIGVASQLGHVGTRGAAAYCASKAGLIQLARVMALDHAAEKIRVNSLSPGSVLTRRVIGIFGSPAAAQATQTPKHPIGRIATPEEIGRAALFLVSEASSFMTGADLLVDGGYTAQ